MCQSGYDGYNPEQRVTQEKDIFDKVGDKYRKENPRLSKQEARQKAIRSMVW